ncbi:MAG TPA: ribonuclease D [Anaerolineaceae bacterium]|nr:ribonuclease D [Anaerolineaceae bacterium]
MKSTIIQSMMEPPSYRPIWVAKQDDLKRMVDDLLRYPTLAVDTESNSLFAYHETVCLIQFSTGEKDYLLDPLSVHDLSLLGLIFADPQFEKIFHAAEYDLICMKRSFGFKFANIFDTMVASRILGRPSIGLAAMIESEFGVVLDKRYQRANWGKRPLSTAMLEYARLDTFYLIPLRNRLITALQENGRWPLAQEDFCRLCQVNSPSLVNGAEAWYRVSGSQDLTPNQAAILQELCNYRDERAKAADVPPFKILGNKDLLEVARSCPQTQEELYSLTNISSTQIERHAGGLLQAVQRGLHAKPLYRPSYPRPDEQYLNRLDVLRNWRKQTGHSLGVESDVILPREIMEQIAQDNPKRLEDLAANMGTVPWRFEHFGGQLLKLLQPPPA